MKKSMDSGREVLLHLFSVMHVSRTNASGDLNQTSFTSSTSGAQTRPILTSTEEFPPLAPGAAPVIPTWPCDTAPSVPNTKDNAGPVAAHVRPTGTMNLRVFQLGKAIAKKAVVKQAEEVSPSLTNDNGKSLGPVTHGDDTPTIKAVHISSTTPDDILGDFDLGEDFDNSEEEDFADFEEDDFEDYEEDTAVEVKPLSKKFKLRLSPANVRFEVIRHIYSVIKIRLPGSELERELETDNEVMADPCTVKAKDLTFDEEYPPLVKGPAPSPVVWPAFTNPAPALNPKTSVAKKPKTAKKPKRLHWASMMMKPEEIDEHVEKHGGHPEDPDCKGWTALHWAARFGHVELCCHLVNKYRCNPLTKTKCFDTPLEFAKQSGNETCFAFIQFSVQCLYRD